MSCWSIRGVDRILSLGRQKKEHFLNFLHSLLIFSSISSALEDHDYANVVNQMKRVFCFLYMDIFPYLKLSNRPAEAK